MIALSKKGKQLSEIIGNGSTQTACVIMSGERRILFYSPEDDNVTFHRADAVKGLQWKVKKHL
jgi:hypothetical protein